MRGHAARSQTQPAANAATPHQMYGGEYVNVTACVPAGTSTAWKTPSSRRTGAGLPSTLALQPCRYVSRRTSRAGRAHESRTDSRVVARTVHDGSAVKYGVGRESR